MENANGSWNYIGVQKVQRGLGRTKGFRSLSVRFCVRGIFGIRIERLVCRDLVMLNPSSSVRKCEGIHGYIGDYIHMYGYNGKQNGTTSLGFSV